LWSKTFHDFQEKWRTFRFWQQFIWSVGFRDKNDQNQDSPVLLVKDEQIKLICLGDHHSMFCLINGSLFIFGSNKSGQLDIGNNCD